MEMQAVAWLFRYHQLPSLSPGSYLPRSPFCTLCLPHPRPFLTHFVQSNTQSCISSTNWKLFEINHHLSWSVGFIKPSRPISSPLATFTRIICLFLSLQVAIEAWYPRCEGSSLTYQAAEQFIYCIAKISGFATTLYNQLFKRNFIAVPTLTQYNALKLSPSCSVFELDPIVWPRYLNGSHLLDCKVSRCQCSSPKCVCILSHCMCFHFPRALSSSMPPLIMLSNLSRSSEKAY